MKENTPWCIAFSVIGVLVLLFVAMFALRGGVTRESRSYPVRPMASPSLPPPAVSVEVGDDTQGF